MGKTKTATKTQSSKPKAETKVVSKVEGVRGNPCPNCHETDWTDVVANMQTVEKQHQCKNCGYVLSEE